MNAAKSNANIASFIILFKITTAGRNDVSILTSKIEINTFF